MNTIADYVSQKDEIARLNKQIDMIAGFYSEFYKKELDQAVYRSKREIKNKNQIKMKYEELKKRYIPKYRGNKDIALELIARYHELGDITLGDIAKKTKLCYSTITGYSSEYLSKRSS